MMMEIEKKIPTFLPTIFVMMVIILVWYTTISAFESESEKMFLCPDGSTVETFSIQYTSTPDYHINFLGCKIFN
jgi:hypothetical protein